MPRLYGIKTIDLEELTERYEKIDKKKKKISVLDLDKGYPIIGEINTFNGQFAQEEEG